MVQRVVIESPNRRSDVEPGTPRIADEWSVELDATLTEKHTGTVEVTRYPVESGVSPTDHARENPDKLQLEGVLTNTPLGAEEQNARGITKDRDSSQGAPRAAGYAQQEYAKLLAMKSARDGLTITGPWRVYKDMVMTSLDASRQGKVGDAIRFTASFEQVRFVQNQVTQLKKTAVPEKTSQKAVQTKKPTEPPKPEETAKVRTSVLKFGGNKASFTTEGSGIMRP
jgi:hypothetical protein